MADVNFDFSGSTVFVSGGTSGINLGIADCFAKAGARLIVMSRSQEKVNAAVEQLSAYGNNALGFAADVRDYAAVDNVMQQVSVQCEPVDILVSGAAGNFPASAIDMSPNGFKAVIDIDLLGTYHVMRASYPILRKPGASVINISAPQAYIPVVLQSHVCAAKAGVDMLTKVLALEWQGDKIRINSIVPGPIDGTEGMARLAPNESLRQAVVDSVPSGRMGEPSDIGNLAMMLSSSAGEYINGAIIPADGGWSLGGFEGMMRKLAKALQ